MEISEGLARFKDRHPRLAKAILFSIMLFMAVLAGILLWQSARRGELGELVLSLIVGGFGTWRARRTAKPNKISETSPIRPTCQSNSFRRSLSISEDEKRVERSAGKGWRFFTISSWIVLVGLLFKSPDLSYFGLNRKTAQEIIFILGLIGLTSYSFSLRLLPRLFWRLFSIPFAFYIACRTVRALALMVGGPQPPSWGNQIIVGTIATVAMAMICIALLRLAGFLAPPPASQPRRSTLLEIFE